MLDAGATQVADVGIRDHGILSPVHGCRRPATGRWHKALSGLLATRDGLAPHPPCPEERAAAFAKAVAASHDEPWKKRVWLTRATVGMAVGALPQDMQRSDETRGAVAW